MPRYCERTDTILGEWSHTIVGGESKQCRECGNPLTDGDHPTFDAKASAVAENGGDWYTWGLRARRAELDRLAKSCEHIKIRPGRMPEDCEPCEADAGRILTVEEAREETPLPHRDCICGTTVMGYALCQCGYYIHREKIKK